MKAITKLLPYIETRPCPLLKNRSNISAAIPRPKIHFKNEGFVAHIIVAATESIPKIVKRSLPIKEGVSSRGL